MKVQVLPEEPLSMEEGDPNVEFRTNHPPIPKTISLLYNRTYSLYRGLTQLVRVLALQARSERLLWVRVPYPLPQGLMSYLEKLQLF